MLIRNLSQGTHRHIVTYGTSLTEGGAWVNQLRAFLQAKFPGLVTVTNSGASAMGSDWGVENIEERVLRKNPDVVIMEFAINDAYLPYNTSPEQCRKNLETMIDRILARYPDCQIILMTMNPPIREHLEIRPRIEDYYQVYRDVAAERRFLLVDHYPAWKAVLDADLQTFLAYVPDGIHPGPLGCEKVIFPNLLAALFGPVRAVSPADPGISYHGYVAMDTGPDKVSFHRQLDYPYAADSPGTRIRFKTDATVLRLEISYADRTAITDHHANNGKTLCLVDRNPAVSFDRAEPSGGRQSIDLTLAASAGCHEYTLVLPIGDTVYFHGLTVNQAARFYPAPSEPATRYVAIGDSITQGFYASDSLHTYPWLLAEKKTWQLTNFGLAGRTTVPADALAAAKLDPDIVTILLGVNDCVQNVPLDAFRENYRRFLANLRAQKPRLPIHVITPLNVPGRWKETVNLEDYRDAIRDLVAGMKDGNLHLIEGPDLIPDELPYFQDGLHPVDAGFALMADRLAAAIPSPA